MTPAEAANAAIRFVLELCTLGAYSYWGFQTTDIAALRWVLGIGMPVLFALCWGAFVSPKAPTRLPDPARVILEATLFGLAALGLAHAGQPLLGAALAIAATINLALMIVLGQRDSSGI